MHSKHSVHGVRYALCGRSLKAFHKEHELQIACLFFYRACFSDNVNPYLNTADKKNHPHEILLKSHPNNALPLKPSKSRSISVSVFQVAVF
jgi:hypothetical protein